MTRFRLVATIMFSCSFAFSQTTDILSVTPSGPGIGQLLTVVYHADAPGAALKQPGTVDLQLLIYRAHMSEPRNQPLLVERSLERDGAAWKGTVTLDDPKAKFILLRVVSGDQVDNNGGRCWEYLVYGSDGKPVRGALQQRAGYYAGTGYFIFTKSSEITDHEKANADIQSELRLYPDNWLAELDQWSFTFNKDAGEALRSTLKTKLDELSSRFRQNEDACYMLFLDYQLLGDSVVARQLRSDILQRSSTGPFAQNVEWRDIVSEKRDAETRSAMMQNYLAKFSAIPDDERENKLDMLFRALVEARKFGTAADVLASVKNPEGRKYNSLAWPLIEKGEELEKAVGWAAKGVELCRNPSPSARPPYVTRKAWEERSRNDLAMVLDTYGFGLTKLDKFREAGDVLGEAYQLTEGEDPDLNSHYLDALVKAGKNSTALEAGFSMVKKGKDNEDVTEILKRAFVQQERGTGGFAALSMEKQQKFQELHASAISEKREQLRRRLLEGRMNQPPVEFTLKDLEGNPVTLSSLKGKVVVIDFWATWCGPCKQSFPYLQKVYDQYKDNPYVRFLAIDTWEREKDYAATLANAKKFMTDKKYTFPVLIDERIIDKYDVDGIPTKFIIDKKGIIAFRSVGFDGPGMVDELTMQIEILLAEAIGSLH